MSALNVLGATGQLGSGPKDGNDLNRQEAHQRWGPSPRLCMDKYKATRLYIPSHFLPTAEASEFHSIFALV